MSTAIMHQSALYGFDDLFLKMTPEYDGGISPSNQNRQVQTMNGTMGPVSGGTITGGVKWEQHPALARAASVPAHQALAGLLDRLVHRRLERTTSEPTPPPPATSRYKTELCRPFEEAGVCKYGDKCQFAHGFRELRNLQRHPKYKTELCRTFHSVGFCPYGPRCHFVHNAEEARRREPSSPGGSLASLSSGGSLASYMSDGSRSPRSPHSPHSSHSPLAPQSPLTPHSPPAMSPPAQQTTAFAFRPTQSPDPEEERLPVFNRLSSAFGDLVIA
ncbi:protein TIS11 [Amyelois transitella]|uniref:protein TIS11 n=1 Tax=Amyelois transitella TaxID=680683 RepID=UPI00067E2C80|nr:protein TIS11 [Amyelois transitella]